MKKHDEGRRAFLVGAAVVGAGAAAGAAVVPEANAESRQRTAAAKIVVAPVENHSHAASGGHGAFFNDDDAATVTAFTERSGRPHRESRARPKSAFSITSISRLLAPMRSTRISIAAGLPRSMPIAASPINSRSWRSTLTNRMR
jgi:hypothetical protein